MRILAVILILILVNGMTDSLIALLSNGWDFEDVAQRATDEFLAAQLLAPLNLGSLQFIVFTHLLQRCFETIAMALVFIIVVVGFRVHAAPSEKERQQQQQILLERALQQHEVQDQALREVTRTTLVNKYNDVIDQLNKLDKEKDMLEQSIQKLDAQQSEQDAQ